jgi:TonB family protein
MVVAARLVPVALFLFACGGSATPPPKDPDPTTPRTTRRVIEDDSQDDGSGDGVEVVSTRGHMEPSDVEAGMAPHNAALEECFTENLKKRKWLGGKLTLTWQITKDGQVTSVVVADSDLGAWDIEKCVLTVARGATFAKPRGGDADFSIPYEFSAKGASVWWEEDVGLKAVGKRIDQIAKCNKDGAPSDEVLITMYVGTRGKVQAAGFSSAGAVPDAWADCVEKLVTGWTLADPRGKVAKMALRYHGS